MKTWELFAATILPAVRLSCELNAKRKLFTIVQGSPRSLEPTTEPPPLLPDRCGYRNDDIFLENSDVHFRVVKGSTATKGQYPWQVKD